MRKLSYFKLKIKIIEGLGDSEMNGYPVSEIISNENRGLIHCQSTLNGGNIITEIYCMNEKSVKAVDVNNFQIRPQSHQKLTDFFFTTGIAVLDV